MKIIKIAAAIILSSFVFTAGAYALCNKDHDAACDQTETAKQPREKRGQGGDIDYLLSFKQLNLSEEQVARLEKLKDDFAKERIRVRAELKIQRMELEKLLHDYDVDIKEIEKKVAHMSELNAGVLYKATISRVEARKILTRKQFDIAKELIEKRRDR